MCREVSYKIMGVPRPRSPTSSRAVAKVDELVLKSLRLLAWMVLAPSYMGELSAPCGVEAKVSIERIGPQGTSAEDRPGSFGVTLAVTLSIQRTCWAAGRHYLSAGPGERNKNHLLLARKKVG